MSGIKKTLGFAILLLHCQNQLRVQEIAPANNAEDVSPVAVVVVTFSTGIDQTSLTKESVVLEKVTVSEGTTTDKSTTETTTGTESTTPSTTDKILGSIRLGGEATDAPNVLYFYPSAILESEATYKVTVANTLKNTNGNLLVLPFTSQFKVVKVVEETPKVESLIFGKQAVDLSTIGTTPISFEFKDVPIVVTFSAPLGPDAVKKSIQVWAEETTPSTDATETVASTGQINFNPFLVEKDVSKGHKETERWRTYIFDPDGGFDPGFKHTLKISVNRRQLVKTLEFSATDKLSGLLTPDEYIDAAAGDFLPTVDPFL